MSKISKELMDAGFEPIKRSPKRLIANIQSIKKSVGKTRLTLTAKKPIGYISVEIGGEEGVVDGFIKSGQESSDEILITRVRMEDPIYPDRSTFPNTKEGERKYEDEVGVAVQTVAGPAMDQFYAAYYASLKYMATTVIDTGTDLYSLARLANFGRLEKIPQLAYVQVKRQFAKLLDDAYSGSGSVLWIHHMKDRGEMVADEKGRQKWQATGLYDMDGCNVVTDKVQAVIELWREDLKEPNPETGRSVRFHGMIVDSRHDADAMGATFTDDFDFADIGMRIFAGTSRQDWI
jgi:hypothetical protein